jgi:hypothetical protein
MDKCTGMTHPVVLSDGIKDATSDHGDMVGTRQVNEEKEADEVTVIVEANTVVHPWTVVV